MKKTIKKFTAVLLVTLMLFLSVPMQSFAAVDRLSIPVIESMEITGNSQKVSMKELEKFYNDLFDALNGSDAIDINEIKETNPQLYESLTTFYLSSSALDYEIEATLATGKTYTLTGDNYYSAELNSLYDLEAGGYITYESYLDAKENDADKIEVNLYGDIYNKLTGNYVAFTEYKGTASIPVADMIVKSITPVPPMPEKIYWDADYIDIDGAEFIIEYADGTTVTETAVFELSEDYWKEYYSLNGKDLAVYYDFDYDEFDYETPATIYFEYLDAYYEMPTVLVDDSLFTGIEITDYNFDAQTSLLYSVSYKLTYSDGTDVSFTKEFTEQEAALLALGATVNAVDGYIVSVYLSLGDYDISNDTINADNYYINVYAGIHNDTVAVENPHKDIMGGALTVITFFMNIYLKIEDFFYNLFDLIFFAF